MASSRVSAETIVDMRIDICRLTDSLLDFKDFFSNSFSCGVSDCDERISQHPIFVVSGQRVTFPATIFVIKKSFMTMACSYECNRKMNCNHQFVVILAYNVPHSIYRHIQMKPSKTILFLRNRRDCNFCFSIHRETDHEIKALSVKTVGV